MEGDKPKEQVVAAQQQEEDAAPRGGSESAAGQVEAVAAGAGTDRHSIGSACPDMQGLIEERGGGCCAWQRWAAAARR